MISGEVLKEIISENERVISELAKEIIPREGMRFSPLPKKVCVLHGVRRSGKSFLLYDVFQNAGGLALYIDFEDERLSGFSAHDFPKIREAFLELKPHLINKTGLTFLLDEIQNIPDWEKYVRRMAEKGQGKMFCAGSSSKIMPREIHTALRGRVWGIELFPFSFREFLRAKGMDPDRKDTLYDDSKILLKKHFQEYVKYGGFPEVLSLDSDFEKRKVLKEYMEAMFFKDLVEHFQIKNIHLLDALRERIFSSFSTEWSLTSFYKQFKDKFPFSKDSLFSYYKYFLHSALVFEVRKLSDSSYKRMRNAPKVYIVDVGLGKHVLSSDTGRLLENIVFLELKRQGREIFYFLEKSECDFVTKNAETWSTYQVTMRLNENNIQREINGLVLASKYLGLREGTILTQDEEDQIVRDGININIIPVWKWLTMRKD